MGLVDLLDELTNLIILSDRSIIALKCSHINKLKENRKKSFLKNLNKTVK